MILALSYRFVWPRDVYYVTYGRFRKLKNPHTINNKLQMRDQGEK